MRVLVISHMYPSTFNEVSGIFVHEQVKEIVKQGHEVMVVSPVPWSPIPIRWIKDKWKRYAQIPDQAIWDGVEVYYPRYVALPGRLYFEHSGKLVYRAIKKTVQNIYQEFPFDLIHAHVALPDGYAAIRLKELYGIPVVVTIHGQDIYVTIKRNQNCYDNINLVLNAVDRIVLVSNKLKELMIEKERYNQKINIIGNGIPNITVKNTDILNKNHSTQTILSVSYLIERKGIEYNLQAIARLIKKYPYIQYIVVGDGDQRPFLESMVSNLGLQEHVIFTGLLPHKEVLNRMADADIFCLPSWNEAFGVVYIEAMAQGIPVIACKGEGIEDVIKQGVNGMLVEPRDVESITEAIEYLLNNPEKAQEIAFRGRELILNKYTWTKNAEMNIKVYEEVLKNESR